MEIFSLNGLWSLRRMDEDLEYQAQVPGSVYADLLKAGAMPDPFWRDNETEALQRMEYDYIYSRHFEVSESLLRNDKVVLRCEGLDTLAEIRLNGTLVGTANNMHRVWEYDVAWLLHAGKNELVIIFHSATKEAKRLYKISPANGIADAMQGFPHIRKAHYMYGWDWGPRLPDAGIWRDIMLVAYSDAYLREVHVRQKHENDQVTLHIESQIDLMSATQKPEVYVEVIAPDDMHFTAYGENTEITISNPQLWWPNGMGKQPLYQVRVLLRKAGVVIQKKEFRIGLRTLTVRRQTDEWGESFAHEINGMPFFAMGANYIPEDNILQRVTAERTRMLLQHAVDAHFNLIRVWGGGYYPNNYFYDLCDELGLVVWQDFMFSCAVYDLTEEFESNIREELIDNICRLRSHACLGLWCGNNEMEMFMDTGRWDPSPRQKADYIKMYEYIFPKLLKKYDPDTFYWPSSPSCGGGFDAPNDASRGDVHYWDVWHENKPFTDYRKHLFRYVSEFGFQSFPCLKTIETFTLPEDQNIFSYVMEKHQRNYSANGKILNYISQMYRYPQNFEMLLYASQLLQAQAIQYGVEHWRRHRGRCMGTVIWQLNDCWPVASWSSIDYFGRLKALHYFAKRFFAPVLISCQEEGTLSNESGVNAQDFSFEKKAQLNISNESMRDFCGSVIWSVRKASGALVWEDRKKVQVPSQSAMWLDEISLKKMDIWQEYFSYSLEANGCVIGGGTVLLCPPKHFAFQDPQLKVRREGNELIVSATAYAKFVEIVGLDEDVVLSDNFFDMDVGEKRVHILSGNAHEFSVKSVYDIK